MFLEKNKDSIGHYFFICFVRCWFNLKRKRTMTTAILWPTSRMLNFIFSFYTLINSELYDLNVLLNRFNKQSAANFNYVLNISEIAILLFLSATASAQSLNCNNVLLSLTLKYPRVRQFKFVSYLRE